VADTIILDLALLSFLVLIVSLVILPEKTPMSAIAESTVVSQ
jgi:hypothetical protein